MARRKTNLADYVEASERREAPRLRAIATSGGRTSHSPWIMVILVAIVVTGIVVSYLKVLKVF